MSNLIDSFGLWGAQGDAAIARRSDVVVTAGAGSGKTRTLVARYMSLLDEGLPPRQLVAVTFTEKAAREMRNRIRAAIVQWRTTGCPPAQRARWDEVEADVDAARIGTIHGLCASLLRAHPAEAGIDPLVSVLDEGLSATLRAQAIEDALGWAVGIAALKPLFGLFTVRELRDVLATLLGARLEARAALASPDLPARWHHAVVESIASFAGSAQVVAAIADLRQLRDSGQLLADAGDKMAAQVQSLLPQWSAMEQALASGEALAAAELLQAVRRDHTALNVGRANSLAKAAVKAIRAQYGSDVEPWLGEPKAPPPDAEVEQQAAEAVSLLGTLFDEACAVYQRARDLRQAVDFDDLEWGAVQLLDNPQVRARWQRQAAALLVDEFQDTNERQRRIVEAIAGIPEGHRGRLFVVGDAKQSIYRFRGADVAVFRRLDRDIRARGGQPIALDVTFRAHAPLVAALSDLLGRALGEDDDPLKPHRVPFAPLSAARPSPRPGIEAPYVEFLYGLGDSSEAARPVAAAMLARRLVQLHDFERVKWEEIALLFRAAAGFPAYEAALERAGIPFVTVAGKGFYDRPEIRDLLNILRALADPWDDLAMAGLLRSPAFGLSDAALYQLRWPAGNDGGDPVSFQLALNGDLSSLSELDQRQARRARETIDHLCALVDRVTVAELVNVLIDRTLYPAILAAAHPGLRLQRNVDKLIADASASGIVRVAEFLEYVDTLREGGAREGEAPAEAGGAVRLMSVHKAKGLEFPVVVIADASRARPNISGPALLSAPYGLVPSPQRFERKPLIHGLARALDAELSDAEDLRVLYVAATRAQEKLVICAHQSTRQAGSWLDILAKAADLDLAALANTSGDRQLFTLPQSGQQISALVQATVPDAVPLPDPVSPTVPDTALDAASLYKPVVVPRTADDDDQQDIADIPIRRITGRRHTDGTIVGTLVHEAIRRWRFPGDSALERLLDTAAHAAGLVEAADVIEHARHASLLLARFRADSRWPELDAAQRYHELPYSILLDGVRPFGVVDLLYRPAGPGGGPTGPWCIVDFKTDHADAAAELSALVEKHSAQLRRYRRALTRLLAAPVDTTLCFLDAPAGVHWAPVS